MLKIGSRRAVETSWYAVLRYDLVVVSDYSPGYQFP
jgi:hypothetical protein